MSTKMMGWHSDPYGLHEARYFSLNGVPTRLVSDAGKSSYDRPVISHAAVDPMGARSGQPLTGSPDAQEGGRSPGRKPPPSTTAPLSQGLQQGWHPDPYGLHEKRYFSLDGMPTRLVSDAGRRSHDDITPVNSPVLPWIAAVSDPGPPANPRGRGRRAGEPTGAVTTSSIEWREQTPTGFAMAAPVAMSASSLSPPGSTPDQGEPSLPPPKDPESHTGGGEPRRGRIAAIGAGLGALAIVIALVATNDHGGKEAAVRSKGTVSATNATRTTVPRTSPTVTTTTPSTAAPPSTTASPVATTTTTPHMTATTETLTTHSTTPTATSARSGSSASTTTSTVSTRSATTTSTTQPDPVAPVTSFGNGTFEVGPQVVAQTYRAPGGTNCAWERLGSPNGGVSAIIASNDSAGPAIVTLSPSDVAFESDGCGTWSPAPTSGPQSKSMGDGTWAVGIDIADGTYQATSTGLCYWARLSSFSGTSDALVASGHAAAGPFTVTVSPSDGGFLSSDCGEWTLVAPPTP
jgi:hypothetical protein